MLLKHRLDYLFFLVATIIFIFEGELLFGQTTTFQFYNEGIYADAIQSPAENQQFNFTERPIRYREAVNYLSYLAAQSQRAYLKSMGKTFEGRDLHYFVISSEDNLKNLDQIRSKIKKLGDPRAGLNRSQIQEITEKTPAIAWMMYSIHGDELSGADAAIQLAYQLVAGEDSLTRQIRRELIVCIHPMENPDGRERYLAQMEQWRGFLPVDDVQSIQHSGVWPWGRGNHYLFDLNRDWFLLVNPESKARVQAIVEWQPQLIVDAHEMGSLDTYLFSPAREPINPHIKDILLTWGDKFARDQASAFDQYGWSYYTREWLENWYPGYSSSWSFLLGAVGILYEQASTDGSLVKRRDGTILTFRQAVHHQFISSLANLSTAAKNRAGLLNAFYSLRKETLTHQKNSTHKAFYIVPGDNLTRTKMLIEKLIMQGIEVEVALDKFEARNLNSFLKDKINSKKLPKGTYIIRLHQPLRPLIEAILEFDPRLSTQFLEEERKSLLEERETRLYEVSAWSLPLAYNVESYWSETAPKVPTETYKEQTPPARDKSENPPLYGFAFETADDASLHLISHLLYDGFNIRVARKPFEIKGNKFKRGSILIRLHENPGKRPSQIQSLADKMGIQLLRMNSSLVDSGPDLGGDEFKLLKKPQVALVTGPGVSLTSFSSLWYLLDRHLQIKHSILLFDQLKQADLSKYNVLILPSTWGGVKIYQENLGEKTVTKLKSWVKAGGTLIGIENAAAFLADTSTGMGHTKLRQQNLKDLHYYQQMAALKNRYRNEPLDSIMIWNKELFDSDSFQVKTVSESQLKLLQKQDELDRLFHPRGAILRATLDPEHWISFGMEAEVPVIIYTGYAYIATDPVQTPARFSSSQNLRLSGLLWPEAKKRLLDSEYVTVEKLEKGQLILFAGDPYFRAYFHGSARLLINSILLGPGMGSYTPVPW